MEQDGMESSQTLCQIMEDYVKKIKANDDLIAQLEVKCKEKEQLCYEKHQEVSEIRAEIARLDEQIQMRQANIDRMDQQIVLYQETVITKLQIELKQIQDNFKSKEKEYTQTIQMFQKQWEEYLTVYMRFPGAAERVAVQNKVKLTKIKYMQKKQEAMEKAKQATQLQEIKARRLEILKEDFLQKYAVKQETEKKLALLRKEIIDRKSRIAAKEEKKLQEQRLLEEQMKVKENELQQQASQSAPEETKHNANDEDETEASELKIRIPSLQSSLLNSINFMSPRNLSQNAGSVSSLPLFKANGTASHFVKSFSQPTKVKDSFVPMLPVRPPCSTQVSPHNTVGSFCAHAVDVNEAKQVTPSTDYQQKLNGLNNASQVLCHVEEIAFNSPNNRKELVLSTDNIAAKIKGTARPKLETPQKEEGNKINSDSVLKDLEDSSRVFQDAQQAEQCSEKNFSPQDSGPQGNSHLHEPPIFQSIERNVKESVVHSRSASPDMFSSQLEENAAEMSEGEAPYDFNAEYGDLCLQSPPAFEPVVSPAHAGFDLSPSGDDDSIKDLQGDGNQRSSFSGFSFFSNASTNLFGGNTESRNSNRDESKSGFSFMF